MRQVRLRPDFEAERKGRFAINYIFENILANANINLRSLEDELINSIVQQDKTIVIICYAPRAGSTFLSQLMVKSNEFNYITNFMARFWDAPYFAGLLEKELNIREIKLEQPFKSDYAITSSPNGPHEFGFFWNKWLPRKESTDIISINDFELSSMKKFQREINAITSLYEKPLFIKNGLVGINVKLFYQLFNNVKFIILKRSPLFIAQSIYKARVEFYNDPSIFLSTKPSNFTKIKDLPIFDQIALQIKGIYNDIYNQLAQIGQEYFELNYEDLVENTKSELNDLIDYCGGKSDMPLSMEFDIFPNKNKQSVSDKVFRILEDSIAKNF